MFKRILFGFLLLLIIVILVLVLLVITGYIEFNKSKTNKDNLKIEDLSKIVINDSSLNLEISENISQVYEIDGNYVVVKDEGLQKPNKIIFYDKNNTALWEKIEYDNVNYEFLFKNGIVISYRNIDEPKKFVKFDFNGNKVWEFEAINIGFEFVDTDGYIAIIVDQNGYNIICFDGNDNQVISYKTSQLINSIKKFSDNSMLIMSSLSETNSINLKRIDKYGNQIFNFNIENKYQFVDLNNDNLYIRSSDSVIKYDSKGNIVYSIKLPQGSFNILGIDDNDLYTSEFIENGMYFIKYDKEGNQIFKAGPYIRIDNLKILNDFYYLTVIDKFYQEMQFIKLDLNGNELNQSDSVKYHPQYKQNYFYEKISPDFKSIVILSNDYTKLNIFDENLTTVQTLEYNKMIQTNNTIIYKDNYNFGYIFIDDNAKIISRQLGNFENYKLDIINTYNPYFIIYKLTNLTDRKVNQKLIKLDKLGEIQFELNLNEIPNEYYEFKNENTVLMYSNMISSYDNTGNKVSELNFSENIYSSFADDEELIIFENDNKVKVLDESLNIILNGTKVGISNQVQDQNTYYVIDQNTNKLKEIIIKQ